MEEIYFANKIFQVKGFLRYAKYYSDQLGCHVGNFYYLDNRIYTFKLVDGKYVDVDGNEYQEFDLSQDKKDDILWCENCEFNQQKPFSRDCEKQPVTTYGCVGIANVSTITNILKDYDTKKALKIIHKYNKEMTDCYTLIRTTPEEYAHDIGKSNKKIVRYLKK